MNSLNFKFVKHLAIAAIAAEIVRAENLPHRVALNEARVRPKKCALSSCDKDAYTMGYCQRHYQKYRVHGNPNKGRTILPKQHGNCSMDGCNKPKRSKNLCATHYMRMHKYGDPSKLNVTRRTGECMIDGCDNRDYARGYCQNHYSSLMKSGKLDVIQPKKSRS